MEARTTELKQTEKPTSIKIIQFRGRELPGNYHSVIIARWLRSLKNLNRYFKMAENDAPKAYYDTYQSFIKTIIARPNVTIRLAALEEDQDVIFGWSVFEGDVLHYVHVQEPYRKLKLSYDLIPKDVKWITHVTKHWETYFMKNRNNRFYKVKFNPFLY